LGYERLAYSLEDLRGYPAIFDKLTTRKFRCLQDLPCLLLVLLIKGKWGLRMAPADSAFAHRGFEDPATYVGTQEEKKQALRQPRDRIRDWVSLAFCSPVA
jgi:hypothetical protein